MAAKELLNIANGERSNGTRNNVIIRGVQLAASRQLRPDFKIVAGRDFDEGKGECIVSKNLTRRYKGSELGGLLYFGDKEQYRVVGVFTAGGSAAESEIWADFHGRREKHRPGRLCLLRSDPRGQPARLREAPEDHQQRHPVQARGQVGEGSTSRTNRG